MRLHTLFVLQCSSDAGARDAWSPCDGARTWTTHQSARAAATAGHNAWNGQVADARRRDLEDARSRAREERSARAMQSSCSRSTAVPSSELPIEPVMAEDGKIYERSAIRTGSRRKTTTTSPSTRARARDGKLPAVKRGRPIEALVTAAPSRAGLPRRGRRS